MSEHHDILALRAALKSNDQASKHRAIKLIHDSREISAVPELLHVLHDDHPPTRFLAALALETIGDEATVDGLIAKLDDESGWVRITAVRTLANIGNKSATPALVNLIYNEPESEIRQAAIQALRKLADIAAIPALIYALQHDIENQLDVVWALADFGDVSAVPVLIALLHKAEGKMIGQVASALARIGDKSAVPDLLDLLRNGKADVDVIGALGVLGDASIVPDLVNALNTVPLELRHAIIKALGKIGDESVIPVLIDQLHFRTKLWQEPIYRSAINALQQIGTPTAIKAAEQWRADHKYQLCVHRMFLIAHAIFMDIFYEDVSGTFPRLIVLMLITGISLLIVLPIFFSGFQLIAAFLITLPLMWMIVVAVILGVVWWINYRHDETVIAWEKDFTGKVY